MFTIDTGFFPGSELPGKGRLLLTNSNSFVHQWYTTMMLVYKNPTNETLSKDSLNCMTDDILCKSLEMLIRDHYAPYTGWFELEGTDLYLAWDNYEDGIYSPKSPISFETASIDTDYDTLYKMVQDGNKDIFCKPPPSLRLVKKGTPLICIKVTRLEHDNSVVAIDIAIHHILVDGCALEQLLNNWAVLCCQLSENPQLFASSDSIKYTIPQPPLFGAPDSSKYKINDNLGEDESNVKNPDIDDALSFWSTTEKLVPRYLYISDKKRSEIREQAYKTGVSFNIYLFAILWKELTAIHLHYNPEIIDNVSPFTVISDTRSTFGAPSNHCSCAAVAHIIRIPVKEVLEKNTDILAQELRAKVKSIATPEKIFKKINDNISLWKQVCQDKGNIFSAFTTQYLKSMLGMPMLLVSSLMNFGYYTLDFGAGGPSYVHMTPKPSNGLIFVMPPNPTTPDNSVELYISLPSSYDISISSVLSEFISSD